MIDLKALCIVGLSLLNLSNNVNGFTLMNARHGKVVPSSCSAFSFHRRTATSSLYSSSNNGMFDPEEASRRGRDKINSISIEERTRRAMLAEATEDRMILLMDELEKVLLEPNDDTDEKKSQVDTLTLQIKSLQDDYNTIVSGEPFALLGDFDSSDDKKES